MAKAEFWFCYLMECSDGSLYTGVTKHLKRRIQQHNGLLKGGARYTRYRQPVALRCAWVLSSRSQACRRELELKKLTRRQKLALISVEKNL
jgi:putative endonuclease